MVKGKGVDEDHLRFTCLDGGRTRIDSSSEYRDGQVGQLHICQGRSPGTLIK